jgi:hypothetical protein
VAGRSEHDELYRVLGIGPGASPAEVTRAYRQQARAWHPDARPGDPDAAAKFRELTAAYEILSGLAPPAPSASRPPSWADPPIRVGPVLVEPDGGDPGRGPAPESLFLLGWLLDGEGCPW